MSEMLPLRDSDPREVGGYRLLGRLGEGGQGVVFLALAPNETRAAVKLLAPTTDPRVRSRFLKEVAAAQQVAGFCTAQVLDAGIFERRPFIVTEYVSGPSLVEVVQQYGPRHGAVLERIAVAALTALGAAHAIGMVHRDFKPGNVLLGPDGPVVIDFGLAAVPGMTTTGLSGQVAIGTPAFMAPEQLAGERLTPAADMWSWAVTIAFTATGELPFKGESLTATAYAILHSEPTLGELPEPLGSIIRRCLSKNPAFRPSARGALSQLVAAGAKLTGPLPPVAPAPAVDEQAAGSPDVPVTVPEPRRGSVDDVDGWAARLAPGPGPEAGPPPAQRGSDHGQRWRRAAVVAASVLVVAGATAAAVMLAQPGSSPKRPAGGHTGTSPPLSAGARARAQAVNWIVQQVSRSEAVDCDPQMCQDLTNRGFTSVNLITPETTDPLGSTLVVATADIQAQYGPRLASVYAPILVASFGSGNARIEIRWVYPDGTFAYRQVQQQDTSIRKAYEAQLLTNSRIALSATSRKQLLNGEIDPLIVDLLPPLAHKHHITVVEFGDQSPGAGPPILLRSVDLAIDDPAVHISPAKYLRWMEKYFNQQRAQFHRAWARQVRLPNGQTALNIGFGAPSPLLPPG